MALRSFDPDEFDASRQFLLDRRCERNHPKRHRTQKRAKSISAKKRQRSRAKAAFNLAAHRKYHADVVAYWAGRASGHP